MGSSDNRGAKYVWIQIRTNASTSHRSVSHTVLMASSAILIRSLILALGFSPLPALLSGPGAGAALSLRKCLIKTTNSSLNDFRWGRGARRANTDLGNGVPILNQ